MFFQGLEVLFLVKIVDNNGVIVLLVRYAREKNYYTLPDYVGNAIRKDTGNKMNRCQVCGFFNRDDKDFCDDCGARMFDGEKDLR